MVKNTGIPYEQLAKWIIEQISENEGVNTTRLEHNVKLPGKTAVHQIDVLWEFDVAGFKYTTIIQAKDWRTQNVDQGKLIQFKGVLDDLPGQPRGIVVTSKGFQSGAREFAEKNGIYIYELREPTEEDWNDRIKTFNISMNIYQPYFDRKIHFDDSWNARELERSTVVIESDNLVFYDESGVKITDELALYTSLTPAGFEELPPTKKTHHFDKPTFVKTQNPDIRVKVDSVEVTISKKLETIEYQLKGEDFVGYVFKNVISGDVKTFPKRGA